MKANIKVAVRVRPALEHESDKTCEKLKVDRTQKLVKYSFLPQINPPVFSAFNERTGQYRNA